MVHQSCRICSDKVLLPLCSSRISITVQNHSLGSWISRIYL